MGLIGLFYPWGLLLQAVAILHFIRRRPDTYWLWIILFGGGLGALVYIVAEIVPDVGRRVVPACNRDLDAVGDVLQLRVISGPAAAHVGSQRLGPANPRQEADDAALSTPAGAAVVPKGERVAQASAGLMNERVNPVIVVLMLCWWLVCITL